MPKSNKNTCTYELINIDTITELPSKYPEEFKEFCLSNGLKLPNISSGTGISLSVMLSYPGYYWTRESCDAYVKKFNINTKRGKRSQDIIQLWNKHSQMGIQTSSGKEKGKYYIVYPYCLSNKHKMRKDCKYDGSEEEKNSEIDKIKSTIKVDYIDAPNESWQLGHKNPGSTNSSASNLVLQPPIQAKYRDNYIFIDSLTKFPMPNKLESMIEKKEIEFTREQLLDYKAVLERLLLE